jgi:hypothetical protein
MAEHEKNYSHKKFGWKNICDDKVEKCEKRVLKRLAQMAKLTFIGGV